MFEILLYNKNVYNKLYNRNVLYLVISSYLVYLVLLILASRFCCLSSSVSPLLVEEVFSIIVPGWIGFAAHPTYCCPPPPPGSAASPPASPPCSQKRWGWWESCRSCKRSYSSSTGMLPTLCRPALNRYDEYDFYDINMS